MLVAVVVALLSGCVESSANEGLGPRGLDPETGILLLGMVISDELFPVVGANVTLVGLASTTSDEEGRFEFDGVPPASYTLSVLADGYEPHSMELDLTSSVDGVKIALTGIPGKSPYVRTLIHDGFSACYFSAVYSAGPLMNPCPFGTPKGGMKTEVSEDWAVGVYELHWRTSEEMALGSSVATEDTKHGRQRGSCVNSATSRDWCPALIWGPSPLRIFVRPNDTEYAKRYAINGQDTWPGGENFTSWLFSSYTGYFRKEINATAFPVCEIINADPRVNFPKGWGCPFGVGMSLGIKVTYYHTMFYLQPPAGRLEDFSAVPDQ